METSKIIHVAAEAVLLGGVVVYFNNQIKSLKNEITELKNKLEKNNEIYNKHFNNIYTMIDKMGQNLSFHMMKNNQQQAKGMVLKKPQPSTTPAENNDNLRNRKNTNTSSVKSKQPKKIVQEDINDFDEDELDLILDEELKELNDEDEDDKIEVEQDTEQDDDDELDTMLKEMNTTDYKKN